MPFFYEGPAKDFFFNYLPPAFFILPMWWEFLRHYMPYDFLFSL